MSTVEDFENAPVGATATAPDGGRATKTARTTYPWDTGGGYRGANRYMAFYGYTLDPSVPTTAREALDLAWELAHPIKKGQVIPKGTELLYNEDEGIKESTLDIQLSATHNWEGVRTLDPLPEPEPDWLGAPAVLATHQDSYEYLNKSVWHPITFNNKLWSSGGLTVHWYELVDVTPLYPKEGK